MTKPSTTADHKRVYTAEERRQIIREARETAAALLAKIELLTTLDGEDSDDYKL
jgi:vacuolar-type H+-ATPase subunit H